MKRTLLALLVAGLTIGSTFATADAFPLQQPGTLRMGYFHGEAANSDTRVFSAGIPAVQIQCGDRIVGAAIFADVITASGCCAFTGLIPQEAADDLFEDETLTISGPGKVRSNRSWKEHTGLLFWESGHGGIAARCPLAPPIDFPSTP